MKIAKRIVLAALVVSAFALGACASKTQEPVYTEPMTSGYVK